MWKEAAHRRRRRPILVALAALLLPLTAAPARATAAPPAASTIATPGKSTAALAPGADAALSRRQDALESFRGRLDAATAAVKAAGFGSYEYDLPHETVLVHWHGPVPKAVADVGRSAAVGGVTVTFLPAPYSATQLLSEQQRLADLSLAGKLPVRFTMIGPRTDAGGLEVGVPPGTAARMTSGVIRSSVALRFYDAAPVKPVVSRWEDIEPYWGGGGIGDQDPNGDACSTAFAVTTSSGAPGMVTAAHCGPLNANWLTLWSEQPYGKATIRRADRDTTVITGKTYDGHVFVGPPAVAQTTGIPVSGEVNPVASTTATVCVSGSFSGYKCNLRITQVGMTIPIPGMGNVWPMFKTQDLDNKGSVGNGDSGGPVFSLTNSSTKAGAMGIISAIDGTATNARACLGLTGADVPGRGCSRIAYHVNFLRVETDLDLRLKTS